MARWQWCIIFIRGGIRVYTWRYSGLYVAVFGTVGAGLLRAKPWGVKAVIGATLLYTADRIQLVANRGALDEFLSRAVSRLSPGLQDMFNLVPRDAVLDLMSLMALLFVLCWWGFAVYAHMRRDYFRAEDV